MILHVLKNPKPGVIATCVEVHDEKTPLPEGYEAMTPQAFEEWAAENRISEGEPTVTLTQKEKLREKWDKLPVAVRAAFRVAKVAVADALADGAVDEARHIIANLSVPPELEIVKTSMLDELK